MNEHVHHHLHILHTASYIQSLKTYRIALLALSLYDYCLTFSAETDLVWKSRKTTGMYVAGILDGPI
ncbi:hypothetical protein L208DRAFT_1407139 [Tricholoma matsutake]|nr:hypothetical protein L208DRAFT_1407139 [Tricholoma matsutake 945]